MRLPEVIDLYLCQRLDANPESRRVSLVGIFNAWYFPAFPAKSDPFDIFATLHGGEGEGTMELEISRMYQEQDLYRFRQDWRCPGRDSQSYYYRHVPGVFFAGEGWYTLTLRFNDEVISSRKVAVYLLEHKS